MNWVDPSGLARWLLLVGHPGTAHNVGNQFTQAAETLRNELWVTGNVVRLVQVRTIGDINSALASSPPITGGVVFFGHGSPGELFLSPDSVLDNLTAGYLSTGGVLVEGAGVELKACNSAVAPSAGGFSIAARLSMVFNRTVAGYTKGLGFTTTPGLWDPLQTIPATGPLWMVVQKGGKRVEFP